MMDIAKSSSDIQICDSCGEINYDGVNFCQKCGSVLSESIYVFCEICGTKNLVDNKTCDECKNIL